MLQDILQENENRYRTDIKEANLSVGLYNIVRSNEQMARITYRSFAMCILCSSMFLWTEYPLLTVTYSQKSQLNRQLKYSRIRLYRTPVIKALRRYQSYR